MIFGREHFSDVCKTFWNARFFRRYVFQWFLCNNQRTKRVYRRVLRAQNSDNPCVKVIIPFAIVFYAFWLLQKWVKTMKYRSRFGVGILVKTLIFIKQWSSAYGNLWNSRIALAFVYIWKRWFSGSAAVDNRCIRRAPKASGMDSPAAEAEPTEG